MFHHFNNFQMFLNFFCNMAQWPISCLKYWFVQLNPTHKGLVVLHYAKLVSKMGKKSQISSIPAWPIVAAQFRNIF